MTTKTSPIQLEKYLKGISYPVKKNDLIKQAETNGAPKDVIDTLKKLPAEEYASTVDVTKAYGKL